MEILALGIWLAHNNFQIKVDTDSRAMALNAELYQPPTMCQALGVR